MQAMLKVFVPVTARRKSTSSAIFTELLQLKLRSRLQSPQAIEDVRQETFARVFSVLRKDGGLRQPERLGAFVNQICNHVLFEHYVPPASAGRSIRKGGPSRPPRVPMPWTS